MLLENLPEKVFKHASGQRALDWVRAISQFHRIQASPGIQEAIEFLARNIRKFTDAKVEIFRFMADGKEKVGTWDNPYAWRVRSAVLELVEPEQKILADFSTEPISLAAQSNAIDIETEVVYIGEGVMPSDYENKDIAGKIVLTESRASLVHRIACLKHGAAGILTYIPPKGEDPANLRRYEGLWPAPGEKKKTGFGFALTQSDSLKIKSWLEEGKTVKVRAKIDATLGEEEFTVLSALIEGTDPTQEVWVIAHVCHPHPGANDNASGSATLMEVLRIISRLLKDDEIERPERSIRFLWVPEWHGTISLIYEHKELVKKCKAVINVDMVGADPAKAGSVLGLYRTPYSLPSTLNNVVAYWLEKEAEREWDPAVGGTMTPLPWKLKQYSAGSDHFMFTDATIGIPAVMLNQYPDKFYHTSADTPDKIDPRQMAYVARVVALSLLTVSARKYAIEETILTHCRDEVVSIMKNVVHKGIRDLSCCVDNPDVLYPKYMRWLEYAKELGQATLDRAVNEWQLIHIQKALLQALRTSVDMAYMAEMMVLRKAYEGACAEIGLEAKDEEELRVDLSEFDIEIKRKLQYAMNPGYVLRKKPERIPEYRPLLDKDPQFMSKIDELLNLCQDWTPLTDIWDRLCFEFGHIEPKELSMIVDDLVDLGIIEKRDIVAK